MKKVLVIDNDHAFRSQLGPWLDARGCSLIDAQDRSWLANWPCKPNPKLSCANLRTPACNGFQFCRELRSHKSTKTGGPIIIATGSGHATDKINALEAGADEYMVKPISLHSLDKFLGRFDAPHRGQDGNSVARDGHHNNGGVRLKFWGVRGSIPSPGTGNRFLRRQYFLRRIARRHGYYYS